MVNKMDIKENNDMIVEMEGDLYSIKYLMSLDTKKVLLNNKFSANKDGSFSDKTTISADYIKYI